MEEGRAPRMTIPTQLVLRALLADPAKELYGVEIGQADGLELARAALTRAYSATARPAWLRPLGEES